MREVRTVIFDLGETLVDETRQWEIVARAANVPYFTLAAVLGSVIERGLPFEAVFEELGVDWVHATDHGYAVTADLFYDDAILTLRALKAAGYRVGIVANQPEGIVEQLEEMDLRIDVIASSASIGVAKPDPCFFHHIVERCGVPAGEIVYVGDRLDNDILPALSIGMQAVFIRRGPWGYIHARSSGIERARWRIDTLAELAGVLERIDAASHAAEPPSGIKEL